MATYYIKEDGGTGNGTSDVTAWSPAYFFANQLSLITTGDTVLFKTNGSYYGHLTPDRASQTYGEYGTGAKPILSGMTTLTSWTLHTGNIYYASLDVPRLNMVTLDGEVKGMGRYPNSGYLTYTANSGNTSISGATIGAIPFDPTGAEVVIRKFRWILDRHIVTSRSGNTLNYSATNFYGNNSAYAPVAGNGYFIQNTVNCLDGDGDWSYDATANRIYMYFSTPPTGREIKVSTLDRNALLNFWTGTIFNNIVFEGSNLDGVSVTGTSGITFNNCDYHKHGGNGLYAIDVTDLEVNSGESDYCLNNGIVLETGGINAYVNSATVKNSGIILGAGKSGDGSYNAIDIISNGVEVSDCVVENAGYNAISVNGNNRNILRNNVKNFCLVKDDGGGIYTYQGSGGNITDNIVENSVGAYEGSESAPWEAFGKAAGIYMDAGSSDHNLNVLRNTIKTGGWGGIVMNDCGGITISENKISDFQMQIYLLHYTPTRVRNLNINQNTMTIGTDQEGLFVHSHITESLDLLGEWGDNFYFKESDDFVIMRMTELSIGNRIEYPMKLKDFKYQFNTESGSLSNPKIYSKSGKFQTKSAKLLVKSA